MHNEQRRDIALQPQALAKNSPSPMKPPTNSPSMVVKAETPPERAAVLQSPGYAEYADDDFEEG